MRRLTLCPTSWVGVLRIGDVSIQVLPKLFRDEVPREDQEVRLWLAREAMKNLLHLLQVGGYCELPSFWRGAMDEHPGDWFEVLTYLYAQALLRELALGAAGAYVERTGRLHVVRGQLDASDLVCKPWQAHKPMCRYDEFSVDNPLNRVFLYVSCLLRRETRSARNRSLLDECVARLSEEVPEGSPITPEQASQVQTTRLTERFEPCLSLARLLLNRLSPMLLSGPTEGFTFMMDMNEVFERAVAGLVRRHWKDTEFGRRFSGYEFVAQPRGPYLAREVRPRQDERFQIKPDLVFRRRSDGTYPLVLDTKYKRWQSEPNQDDVYQMVAYATALRGVETVMLVYPEVGEASEPSRWSVYQVPAQGEPRFELRVGFVRVDQALANPTVGRQVVARLASHFTGGT